MSDPWWSSDLDPWQQSGFSSAMTASSAREPNAAVGTSEVARSSALQSREFCGVEPLSQVKSVHFNQPHVGGSALNPEATPFPAPKALNPDATPFPAPTALNPEATPFPAPSALNPDATPFPEPAVGYSGESRCVVNTCCLDYEARTLKEHGHVTFDGACSYIVQKADIKMDVLLSETATYPALNTLLRKEQALRMYLLSYRSKHSVWSVQDVREQFPSSALCCKEGLPGTWEALSLGDLYSHPLFKEIFPEMSDATDNCQSTAIEAMEALQAFRSYIGVASRVELPAFEAWYEAKHGIALACKGLCFPLDRLPLVLSAQNVAFKQFGEISRAARASFIANVSDFAVQSVQSTVDNCQDWCHVNRKEIRQFVERWSGAARVTFPRAVAEISMWVQHILDADLDPVVQLLCAAFVSSVQKDDATDTDIDDDLPVLRSPAEVIRFIQMELANCQRISLEWLLGVEQSVVGHHRCFEEALGYSQKMSFLQFIADKPALADKITEKINAPQTTCSSEGKFPRATLVKTTLSALDHEYNKSGISSPIVDVEMLLAVESRVRRQLQITGDCFSSWKSFAQFMTEATELHEAGWCMQTIKYEPFEHWMRHVGAVGKLGGALADTHFRVIPGSLSRSSERQSLPVDGIHWEADLLETCIGNGDASAEDDANNLQHLVDTDNSIASAPSFGLLGEVTEKMAISALVHAPLLKNAAENTLWSHTFQPSLGHLHVFLEHIAKRDGLSNHGLAFIIPSMHLAGTSLAPTFLRIPCESSYEDLDKAIREGCITTTAGHLCSLTCQSKASMELHAFHFSQAIAQLSTEDSIELCVGVLSKLPERLAQGSLGRNVILPAMKRAQGYADMALLVAGQVEGALLRLGLLGVTWKISSWSMKLQSVFEAGFDQDAVTAKAADAPVGCIAHDMVARPNDEDDISESEEVDDVRPTIHPAHVQHDQECNATNNKCVIAQMQHDSPEDVLEGIYAGFMLGSAEASALQESLGGALQRLSEDLYRDRHHHVFELLQNFADNSYPIGAPRLVKFVLDSCQLVALNNEVGFTEDNVRALCAVNMSTKQIGNAEHTMGVKIGCKGIGFKSVFKITDTPIIHSGPWHFNFDASLKSTGSPCKLKGLGFIVPHKLPSSDKQNPTWTTEIRLPFKSTLSELDRTHIAEDISNLDREVLLFIPIDAIETCDATGRVRMVRKEILCEHVVRLWSQSGATQIHLDYLVQKHARVAPDGG